MDSILEYVTMKNKNHDITLLNAIKYALYIYACLCAECVFTARSSRTGYPRSGLL